MSNPMPIEKQNWEIEFHKNYGIDMNYRHGTLVEAEQVEKRLHEIKTFIKNLLLEREKELWKKMEDMKRQRKPTHGTCCTCQECGHPNDYECECPRNEAITEVQSLLDIDEK